MAEIDPDVIEFEDLDICDPKHVEGPSLRFRRNIVFVTIADPQMTLVDIEKLMETGMNIAQFKTSHSTRGDKVKLISKVDKAASFLARKYGVPKWPCATCIELKTCVTQTGLLEEDLHEIIIYENTEIILTYEISEYNKCNQGTIFVDNPYLTTDVKVGMEINIAQDEIIMKCTSILNDKSVKCLVTKTGRLHNMDYVCMRGAKRTRPYLTKKDLYLIKFAVEYQVDMIIINYARDIETLKKIKRYLGNKVRRPLIITGICTEEGLSNVDEFICDADGIVLSREFIAYEVEPDLYNRMHQIQNIIAAKCRQVGKPFYVSGDVFSEALMTGTFCSREISDVTNALLQGASGFILKECPNTDYLIETMKTLNDICTAVETLCNDKTKLWQLMSHLKMPMNAAEASAISCALVANQTKARCIIVPTVTGRTVSLLNWMWPIAIIIAISTKVRTTRILNTYRGVMPLLYKGTPERNWFSTVQARIQYGIQYAVEKHWIVYGDHYVTLEKGTEESSFCDTVRVWNVTITKKNIIECPESYHDFSINDYVLLPPIPSTSKAKNDDVTKENLDEIKESHDHMEHQHHHHKKHHHHKQNAEHRKQGRQFISFSEDVQKKEEHEKEKRDSNENLDKQHNLEEEIQEEEPDT